MAEAADAGPATGIMLFDSVNPKPRFVTAEHSIREIWEKEGSPQLPHMVDYRLKKLIREGKDLHKSFTSKLKKRQQAEEAFDKFDPDVAEIFRLIGKAIAEGKLTRTNTPDGAIEFAEVKPGKPGDQREP